jgi:ubiquinol-cytochrome c reductase cytochrome c1 subunit
MAFVRLLSRRVSSTALGAALGGTTLSGVALCNEDHIPPILVGFDHEGPLQAFDAKAVRRGFQVYKEVCSTCHSMERMAFRNMVEYGAWTESEAKEIAEAYEIVDGPNDEGEMFERPGKLSDNLPSPYANEEAARAANAGALPPDLSLIVKARHDGVNYVFALLSGYVDAPAGKTILPGLYYNPYFPGGAIGMPAPLMDGQVEYPDGTPATVSQMAKDVSTFLNWVSEPEHDDRKKAGMQWILALAFGAFCTGYMKRHRFAPLKSRKITYLGN